MPVLSTRIVLDCFYPLIFYSEKFSTDVCRLPYAVNVNLNLSNVWLCIFLLKYLFESVCLIVISSFPSHLWTFLAFGSPPPCVPIVLTLTTLALTFANTVDFSPLRLQYPQEPPEFPSICPPSIAEFPLFNQLGLPNLTRNRSVVCISNWSPFYPPFQPPSLPFLLPLRMSLDFSCGRTLRERLRSTRPAALISALTLNGTVAAPLD